MSDEEEGGLGKHSTECDGIGMWKEEKVMIIFCKKGICQEIRDLGKDKSV